MPSQWSKEEIKAAIAESDARSPGGGRPKKKDKIFVTVNVGVPEDVLAEFDEWCKANEYTRSQFIRHLMKKHVKSVKEK